MQNNYYVSKASNGSKVVTVSTSYSVQRTNSFTREYKHWLESDHFRKIYWENMSRREGNLERTSKELEKHLDSYLNVLFEDAKLCGMAYCLLQEVKKKIDYYWIADSFRRGK